MIQNYFNNFFSKIEFSGLYISALTILWISAIIILVSVIYKFIQYLQIKKQRQFFKKHPVETFSMLFIAIIVFNLLQANIGVVKIDFITHLFFLIFGIVIVAISTVLHIWSKIELGRFWSNQIEILRDHEIVTTGPYGIVRHPMYSSVIFWLIGLSFMFVNYGAFIITFIIFIPMMISRAKAEDKLLKEKDVTSFNIYAENTNILIPHFNYKITFFLKILLILFLGYSVIYHQMSIERVVFLFASHFMVGLIADLHKVRFSYRNKSFFLIIIFLLTIWFSKAYWLYYFILIFNIWGLKYNCPCMFVHEKYHGCPCFRLLKRVVCK